MSTNPKPSLDFVFDFSDQISECFLSHYFHSKSKTLNKKHHKLQNNNNKQNIILVKNKKDLQLPLIDFEEVHASSKPTDHDHFNKVITYGLNIRQNNNINKNNNKKSVIIRGERCGNPIEERILGMLKKDLKRLPDEEGNFEQYKEVPVEGFGAMLLRSYGWHKWRGIGRNSKGVVGVVEYKKWRNRDGLGFRAYVDDLARKKLRR